MKTTLHLISTSPLSAREGGSETGWCPSIKQVMRTAQRYNLSISSELTDFLNSHSLPDQSVLAMAVSCHFSVSVTFGFGHVRFWSRSVSVTFSFGHSNDRNATAFLSINQFVGLGFIVWRSATQWAMCGKHCPHPTISLYPTFDQTGGLNCPSTRKTIFPINKLWRVH